MSHENSDFSVPRSALNVERSASAADAENPWPGLATFTEAQSGQFHGRDEEIRDLTRRTERNALTVLFGQSGLGKSSLLQAGVFPRLRRNGYWPIYVRLDHGPGAPTPTEQIKALVHADTAKAGTWTKPGSAQPGESLWEFFHHRDDRLVAANGKTIVPVLVFDQFEELFTLGAGAGGGAERARAVAFMGELAELVENRPSERLVARLEESSAEMEAFDFGRTDYRVVITLREDFLPHLEGLKTIMPALMENRMRLAQMTGTQALEAVIKPGGALVTEDVARAIVEFVAGAKGGSIERLAELEVEPPLLSVICRELNERRKAQGQARISADLVSGNRREILTDFYERSVADLPEAMRRFVEDRLLTKSGFRDNLALETALEEPGVTRALVDTLVSRRLLRIEDRLGVHRVELTHDVLAEVIRASRDTRQQRREAEASLQREREAKEAAEAQLAASRAQAAAARKALWQARVIAAGCALLALGAIAGGIFGYVNLKQAREAEARAETAAQAARRAQEKEAETGRMVATSRAEAEKLVSFLLADFYEELASTGRLSTVGRLAKQTADYYANLPQQLRSRETERGYAVALARYGAVLASQGSADGEDRAGAVLTSAIQKLGALYEQGDRSEQTLIGLTIAHRRLARMQDANIQGVGAFDTMKRLVGYLAESAGAAGASRALRLAHAYALVDFGYLQSKWYGSREDAAGTLNRARQLFVELGGASFSDPDAASGLAVAVFQAGEAAVRKGQMERSDEFLQEARRMADAVLARRPGDLQALRTRAEVSRRMAFRTGSFVTGVRIMEESERYWTEYLRHDPTDDVGWGELGMVRDSLVWWLVANGRIQEAADKVDAALAIEKELAITPTLARFVMEWLATATEIASLRGRRTEAEAYLQRMRAMVQVRMRDMAADSNTRVYPTERVLSTEREMLRNLGDDEAVYRKAKEALERSANYRPSTDNGRRGKLQRENEARADLVEAALRLGRLAEAEEICRRMIETSPDSVRGKAILGMILVRQGKVAEAREAVAGIAEKTLPAAGSPQDGLWQKLDAARLSYVLAVTQPDDAEGRRKRQELLRKGAQLVDELAPEVREMRVWREVRDWITAAMKG